MAKISVLFDPAIDNQSTIAALVSRIYGTDGAAGAAVTLAPAAPAGEDEPPAAGETAADPATIDGNGVPHDKRIHSAKPTMTDKGVWRKRKGVDDVTFNSVVTELRARAGGAPQVQQQQAPVLQAPAGLPALTLPVTQPPVPQRGAYEIFVDFCTQNIHSADNPTGKLTKEWIDQSLASLGVAGGIAAAQHIEPARVKAIHAQFAQALGLPGPV